MGSKIDQCLQSVFTSTADKAEYEVIVCDSSNDGSIDIFKKWIDKEHSLKVIRSKHQLNIGLARNIAVQQARGDYVFCLDIDDKLASLDALKTLIDSLDGKDIYVCSYYSRRDQKNIILKPTSYLQLAQCPVACWTKAYKRQLYVPFPKYMPEDVLPHYLLIDQCKSFGYIEKPIVDYDNTPENKGAISRTFDWLFTHPTNLMQLAREDTLQKLGLREEFLAGVIHNLADMWSNRDLIQNPQVKVAYMNRLNKEYSNFMSGVYVH